MRSTVANTRKSSWWIPGAAFVTAAVFAVLAAPSLGFSSRAMMDTTGKKYYCTLYCTPGGEPVGSQESDVPLSKDDGWDCHEINPVNFMSGANFLTARDLGTSGLSQFSITRMYLQNPEWADHGLGPCWRIGWLYRVVQNGPNVSVIAGPHPVTSFTDNFNGTYTADFNYVQTLTSDTVNHLLVLTDARGKQWKFFDFSGTWNPARQGRLKEFDDRAGNITTTTYGTSGVTLDKLLEVQQTDPNPALLHRFSFAYYLSGASVGLLSSITHSQTVSGVTTTVRVGNYSYYATSGPNGPAGTLQRVKIADAAANVLDTTYYRYDAMALDGFVPLRYAVNPKAYDRLLAALGSEAAIDAAADSTIATYADYYFQYDAQHRVTQEIVQGQGCGCGSSGSRGTFAYSFQTALHGQPDGPNVWRNKCTVTMPDGNQRLVYTNSVGQTMLDIAKEAATGNQWRKYFVFNTDYSLAATAFPSAVTGHDETTAALVTSAHLPDSSGLWHLFNYYATTNLPAGAVAKYRSSRQIRQGELGTPILIETTTFTSRVGGATTIYPLASRTVYRNTDGTGGQTTTFSYTWQGTTTAVLQLTTTYPVVPTGQNGSGSATALTGQLDAFGRQTWLKDADGFIHAVEYDTLTGAVTKQIADVNTALVTNEPAGWATPAGGGLQLTTSFLVDVLGRTTKVTDPLGNISYTVYKDPQHEARTYAGWDSGTNLPTGPTQLFREDRPGSYNERLTMTAAPAVTGGVPTGAEAISGLQSLSRDYFDTGSRLTNKDSYFNLTGLTYSQAPNLGTLGTHFYRMSYNYDLKGRKDRFVDWTGTVARTVFDVRDRAVSSWIGTDDTPTSGDWSPTNTAGTNLVQVTASEFDGGGIGDGNLTKARQFTSVGVSLDTVMQYDFRNRQLQSRGPDNVAVQNTYDNLNHVTVLQTYADGDVNFVIGATELRAKSQSSFDEKGQLFQSTMFHVDPSTGALGNSLTQAFWTSARGLPIKTRGPNGEFRKTQYDGAGRPTKSFVCFDDAETLYADAATVTNDTVIDQEVTTFDLASQVIQSTHYRRTSTTAKLEDLSVSWAAGQSRRTFVARWYDRGRRPTDVVDYGTNGGSNLSRPATAPAPNTSDNYLVTHFGYDVAGRPNQLIDNKARVSQKNFDALGRTIATIENFTAGGTPVETDLDVNRTTQFVFDSAGRLSQRIALNPKGSGQGVAQQVTTYVYGTIANQASPAVFRNDVLVAEIAPDSDDTYNPLGPAGSQLGAGADGVYDRIETTYDYASRQATMQDPRGVLHTYTYDSAGRRSVDTVTTLPAGVDGSIRRIGTAYDSLSRPLTQTSTSDTLGATVVNQIRYTYDGWGNELKCEQEHVGSVVPGTSASYQTAYVDGATGGAAKYVRKASATYPNGRVVFTNYPASGVGDKLSRADNLANDAAGTTQFSQYTYLGLDDVGRIDHPLVTNGLRLEVDTGGNPTEWDRFGRVLDQRWKRSGATFNYDRYQYTYDRANNRLTRDNTPNSPPTGKDEFYAYDGLDRQTKFNRGTLASGQITDVNANFSQKWTQLESVGNWREYQVAPTGANNYSFVQARSHNSANEIDADNNDANAAANSIFGSGGADWIDPTYDKSGNLKSGPQAGTETSRQWYTYDAWNRLSVVNADAGGIPGTELVEYQYDARNRRVAKLVPNGANWNRTDYYFSCGWQCVEERTIVNVVGKATAATIPHFQWIWDPRYIDAVVLRDENKDGDGSCTGGADQRLFYTQDANFNTTGLISTAGAIVERYVYDAYGKASVLTGTWTAQSPTLFNNEILFGGYRSDPETSLYDVRNRAFHATLGRWLQRDPMGYHDGNSLYEYVRSNPIGYLDPAGLACCCKSITVSNAPVAGGIGGMPLGPITGADAFAYGFKVRIEAAVTDGDDICSCDMNQWIFALHDLEKNNGSKVYFLFDGSHHSAVDERAYNQAKDAWLNNTETFHHDAGNNRWCPSEWWNKKGKDWMEYSDAPGWRGKGRGAPAPDLPAANYKFARERLKVIVTCKGSDGSEITAMFWLSHSAKSNGTTWGNSDVYGPVPPLPHTWTR